MNKYLFLKDTTTPNMVDIQGTLTFFGFMTWLVFTMLTSLTMAFVDAGNTTEFGRLLEGHFFFSSFIVYLIGKTIAQSIIALEWLKKGYYSRIKYFWFFFIPILNLITTDIMKWHAIVRWAQNLIADYIGHYSKASNMEFENTLTNILESTKRMNQKIKDVKTSCNTKTDALIIQIMEASQETIKIVKG